MGQRIYHTQGIATSLRAEGGGQGAKTGLYQQENRIRRLTPTECERLQGFPDGWTEYGIDEDGNEVKISDTQRYKCLGNAVTVNVIEAIISRMIDKGNCSDGLTGREMR
jgi:DNA (cytosine-5)-methyltransferase 1